MSSVLWANLLDGDRVVSDEKDKYALFKHSKKLDRLCHKLGVSSFLAAQDFTDYQFNVTQQDLPAGMDSTDDLMAQNGNWIAAQDAVVMLQQLMGHIDDNRIKFGFFSDDREQVLAELEESLQTAQEANRINGRFNFSVVM